MKMSDPKFIWRFTPNRTNPETLKATFVQRQAMVEDALERVRESALTGNKHQLLLVGPRGIGKTHFVTMVQHRVTEDAQLHDRLRIAWLNEDETGTSFLDLLLRILHALSAAYADEFPTADLEPIFRLEPNEARRAASRLLFERLAGRTLLLIVENLDALFAGLGDEGQKQLRAFLQEHATMAILATSQQLFEGISRRTSPFFGFFQIEHLQPLNLTEAVELLTKIAQNAGDEQLTNYLQTPEGRSRVRALHHLSGGNHRVYIVLSQFIDRQSLDELIGPFEKMLDEMTPYYQERLRWLSPQQRKIVEFLCSCSSPMPVKTIANRLFITEQTAASQLKILREVGYVLSHTRGRESLYELTEPLMRLSYEVKQNGRQPLRLIVDFLRIWYRPEELRDRLVHLSAGALRDREYMMAAIEASLSDDPRTAAILADIEKAKEEGRLEEAVIALEELANTRGTFEDWYELGAYKLLLYKFQDAISCFEHALLLDPNDCATWNALGGAYFAFEQYDKALSCFDKSIQINPNFSLAWNSRGAVLFINNRYLDALECYERAVQINPTARITWENLGNLYTELKMYEKALSCFDKSLEIDPNNIFVWVFRGETLSKQAEFEKAIFCYDKIIEFDSHYSIAWNNRSVALCNLSRYSEALDSNTKALAMDSDYRLIVLYNRAGCLFGLGRWEEGFDSLEKCCLHEWSEQDHEIWSDIDSMISLILHSTFEQSLWHEHVERIIKIYDSAKKLPFLGEGLVLSLRKIDAKMLSQEALDAWRQIWLDAGAGRPDLAFGLKLFDVGMKYLITGDRRVLLDLLSTERPIVMEALGLAEESES